MVIQALGRQRRGRGKASRRPEPMTFLFERHPPPLLIRSGSLSCMVRLGELCAATSLFTDLGTGQPVEHGLRACLVSMRLAEVLGLDTEVRREVFFVTLLRFLGCTAESHHAAELFNGDDVGLMSGMAPVTMGSTLEEFGGLVRTANRTVGFPGSLRSLASALADPAGGERLLDAHCEVASRLAFDMGLPAEVSTALDRGYARWDGRGVPRWVGGEEVPMSVRVSVVARDLELWGREFGSRLAGEILQRRRERAYAPAVVDAAIDVGIDALRDCDDDLWDVVVGLEPAPWLEVAGDELPGALAALGDFADLKAPEFTGHSRRVARIVTRAADIAGLAADEAGTLALAGSVHDLGVVAAPVRVWRTAPRLGPAEEEQARVHPMWSERLLSRVSGLEQVAACAGRHHERLDGTGYPTGAVDDLDRSAGILACAEFYVERSRMGRTAAAELAALGTARALPAGGVRAVLDAVDAPGPSVVVERPAGLTEREVDVLRLLAGGMTNRQIAEQLGISKRTVGSHVEHIYLKAGVRTRAAATLFAVRHNLID